MFKITELLKASGARLIRGNPDNYSRRISIDSRSIKKGEVFLAIKGERFDGHDFIIEAIKKGANCIIKEASFKIPDSRHPCLSGRQAIPDTQNTAILEVKDTIKALGDIALFNRNKFDIPVIAVTGSNGKTTTKDMLFRVLCKKFKVLRNEGTKNNQIGLPLALLNLNSAYDLVVLEIGTNHFGEIKNLARICSADIGIITNIGPAHLKYFNNLAGVFREKYDLIKNLRSPHIGILNSDDAYLKRKARSAGLKPFIIGYGINNPTDFRAVNIKRSPGQIEFRVNQKYKFTLATIGYYNIYNALAAITVGRIFGLEYRDMSCVLAKFDFPKGRLSRICIEGINFIDDTYNSNPGSLNCALQALEGYPAKGEKIFIMGDMLELGKKEKSFHVGIATGIAKICDTFIGVGNLAELTARALRSFGFRKNKIFTCQNARQARDILRHRVSPGASDIVLVKGSRLMKMEEVFKKT
ncbi:MAG: hypothetical protein DRP74_03810 [Candidatus Omnitrophota bacterium]|nr:MAG: hypothetical protein DRP74_03810 [Candidatus Omnitrophota bacterium]